MKVKVGNKIYDGSNEPIMIIVSAGDRENIANMLPDCTKYCQYPNDIDQDIIEKWMEDEGAA
jgi:hypothetical protein